jgi:hypothetical protein
MNRVILIMGSLAAVLVVFILPAISCAQTTDRSELTQFLNETANQGPAPTSRNQDHHRQLATV